MLELKTTYINDHQNTIDKKNRHSYRRWRLNATISDWISKERRSSDTTGQDILCNVDIHFIHFQHWRLM